LKGQKWMKKNIGYVESVYLGSSEKDVDKSNCQSLNAQLSGFVGDRHGFFERETWEGDDKQPEGTIRRNERQWSAVSAEELAGITKDMDLAEPLQAGTLGANLCFSGIPHFSHLPKGTVLRFPSGAELMVEEYNPPCLDMGEKIASMHTSNKGQKIANVAFSSAAKYSRGLVGVIEVPGMIISGDTVEVIPYKSPLWLGKF
jgi:MOSC domain-containing protein YiiM